MNPKLDSNASALLLFCFRPEKFNLPPGSRQIGDFLRRFQLVDFVFHQKFMRFKSNEYANWWRALRVIDVELRRRFFARASVKVTRSPPPSLCENAKNNKKLFAALLIIPFRLREHFSKREKVRFEHQMEQRVACVGVECTPQWKTFNYRSL